MKPKKLRKALFKRYYLVFYEAWHRGDKVTDYIFYSDKLKYFCPIAFENHFNNGIRKIKVTNYKKISRRHYFYGSQHFTNDFLEKNEIKKRTRKTF